MSGAGAYEELHREAELQGLRVHLESEGTGERTRLKRLAVLARDDVEVAALRIRPDRGLERTAAALVAFLQARRAAETP